MTAPVCVVLDAQAIVKEGFGTSGAFRHLLRAAADGRVTLIVPELAVAETVFVLRRRLSQHEKALKELPALLRAAGVRAELGVEQLLDLADQRLRADLAVAGVTTTPAPSIDADELARRILERRKPTKALKVDGNGKEAPDQPEGFRDQLLWAHVREAAVGEPVVFVTGNTKDFAEPDTERDGRAKLHPQLSEDLDLDQQERRSTGHVELFLDVPTLVGEYLQEEDVLAQAEDILSGDAGAELGRLVAQVVNERGVRMDEFTPSELVEGDLEEAVLATFAVSEEPLELVDAYIESSDPQPRRYGINVTVSGEGAVDWYVSAVTGGDIEAFGEHVENVEDGGGLLQWQDDRVPVQLSVYVQYTPETEEWTEISIDYASMPKDEVERRAKEHRDEEFRRLQALGLEPSDEEIAEMAEQHEQQRERGHVVPPKARKKRRDDGPARK